MNNLDPYVSIFKLDKLTRKKIKVYCYGGSMHGHSIMSPTVAAWQSPPVSDYTSDRYIGWWFNNKFFLILDGREPWEFKELRDNINKTLWPFMGGAQCGKRLYVRAYYTPEIHKKTSKGGVEVYAKSDLDGRRVYIFKGLLDKVF